jgi:co-chaperonin GroES (HSP10)
MNVKTIKPTLARVLVEKCPKEEVTASGLIVNSGLKMTEKGQLARVEEEDTDKTFEAIVLAVGPDVKYSKVGDRAIISKYSGMELEKDTDVYLINELDILATV